MTATQLLVINILMDGPPALALGIEKRHGDVMNNPPRALVEPLPNVMDKKIIGFLGVVMVIGTLSIFALAGGGLVTGEACDGFSAADSPDLFTDSGECDATAWDTFSEAKFDYARTVAFAGFILFQLFCYLLAKIKPFFSKSSIFTVNSLSSNNFIIFLYNSGSSINL